MAREIHEAVQRQGVQGRGRARGLEMREAAGRSRTSLIVIDIQLPDQIPALDVKRVVNQCLASTQPSLSMDLSFNTSRPHADYKVTVEQDPRLRSPTADRQALNDTTSTFTTCPYNATDLLQLIQYLGFDHLAMTPSFQATGTWTHDYEYSFEPHPFVPKAPANGNRSLPRALQEQRQVSAIRCAAQSRS